MDPLATTLSFGEKLMKSEYEASAHSDLIEAVHYLEATPPYSGKYYPAFEPLISTNEPHVPSVVQAPKLELKPLPQHLKYVYLGEEETLPVIIANNLSNGEEERLIRLLRTHKRVIGWTIADIRGISPSRCMHRILLEDNAKPSREAQIGRAHV